jgi:fumarate hydratase class II
VPTLILHGDDDQVVSSRTPGWRTEPHIGYHRAAEIAKKAHRERSTQRQVTLASG